MNPDDVVFTEEEKKPTPPSVWEIAQTGKPGRAFRVYFGFDEDGYAKTAQITTATDNDGDVWFRMREYPQCWHRKSAVSAIIIQEESE